MYWLLLILHVAVCFVLIVVVLLQSGKGADLAGAFGGGGSQTALGSRGAATFLSKATTASAVLFMFTSLSLAIYSSRRTSAVLQSAPPAGQAVPAAKPPAAPATGAPAGQPSPNPAPQPSGSAPGSAKPAAPTPSPNKK